MALVKFSKEQKREYAIALKQSQLVQGIDPGAPIVQKTSQAFRDKVEADLKRMRLKAAGSAVLMIFACGSCFAAVKPAIVAKQAPSADQQIDQLNQEYSALQDDYVARQAQEQVDYIKEHDQYHPDTGNAVMLAQQDAYSNCPGCPQ